MLKFSVNLHGIHEKKALIFLSSLYFTYVDIFFISSTKLYLYLHNCTPFNKITLICNYILSH